MRPGISRPLASIKSFHRPCKPLTNALSLRHVSSNTPSSPIHKPVVKPSPPTTPKAPKSPVQAKPSQDLVYKPAPARSSKASTTTTATAQDSSSEILAAIPAPAPSTLSSVTTFVRRSLVWGATAESDSQTVLKSNVGFAEDTPEVEDARSKATKYKSAERRVKMIIVAMPILLVTSWVLYGRCEFSQSLVFVQSD